MILHRSPSAARLVGPILALALLAACGERENANPAAPASPPAATPAPSPPAGSSPSASEAAPSGEATADLDRSPLGVFVGTLPCADCDGIHTELTLYLEPDTFERRESRIGGTTGPAPRVSQGKWVTLAGTPSDPNATVVQLDPENPETRQSFLEVGGDQLELLDHDLNALDGREPHSLVRQLEHDDEDGE